MKKKVMPPDIELAENELLCWGGASDGGWAFHVVLFRGEPRGEMRFFYHDVPTFTHPIGLEEIAMFKAEREDLLKPYLEDLIRQHRPH
jgi:hypothetical protein